MTKVLTLTQPWATMVVRGDKRIETRTWATDHRGQLLIHAAKTMPAWAREFAKELRLDPDTLPLGCIIGSTVLLDVVRIETLAPRLTPYELSLGDYSVGRFGWLLDEAVELVDLIPARGRLGLWEWSP
jgi:hypothetical protein